MTIGYTRSRIPPWGLAGGDQGTPNYVEVVRAAGGVERYTVATGVSLGKDDVVRIVTGNGGGFGNPLQRSKELIRSDLRNGYVTAPEVDRVYGGV